MVAISLVRLRKLEIDLMIGVKMFLSRVQAQIGTNFLLGSPQPWTNPGRILDLRAVSGPTLSMIGHAETGITFTEFMKTVTDFLNQIDKRFGTSQ